MFSLFSFKNKKSEGTTIDKIKQEKIALPQIENIQSQFNPSVNELCKKGNCYIVMYNGSPGRKLDVKNILNGSMDFLYKSTSGFQMDCPIFSNFELACKRSTHMKGVSGFHSTYIMVIGCSEEEVKKLAAEGKFHTAIVRAINAKQFYAETCGNVKLLNENKRKNIEVIENPAFDPEVLTGSQSSDNEVNFQP